MLRTGCRRTAASIYTNEAACRELGYRRELLALSIPWCRITPLKWKAHWAELGRAGTLRFDGLHRRKDGSLSRLKCRPASSRRAARYACGIVRNMSIRVEAERAGRQRRPNCRRCLRPEPHRHVADPARHWREFIEVNDAFYSHRVQSGQDNRANIARNQSPLPPACHAAG